MAKRNGSYSNRTNVESIEELRKSFKTAVNTHGEETVMSAMPSIIRNQTKDSLLEYINQSMHPNDAGRITNALKSLEPKREKVNKYAEFSKAPIPDSI